jgi:branched-chain amino acid aminotransferase
VIRVYDGTPFALAEHLDRLERSAFNLRLGWEVPRRVLEEEVAALIAQRAERYEGLIRIVLTRGGRRLVLTEPLPSYPELLRLAFVTYAPTRLLDGVKSLSYAANMLASRVARERGFDEALLVTPHGRVLEAPTSSIFWVDEAGTLCTPALDEHILASITRDAVMKSVDVEERPLPTDELLAAREAFIASTTREVHPVAAIETREFADAPGEVTRQAMEAVRSYVEESLRAVRV